MARHSIFTVHFLLVLLALGACRGGLESTDAQVDLTQLTALEAVRAMKSGEFTPSEYAEALLTRAEALEHLNAFIHLDASKVRDAAATATRQLERGEPVGVLFGLPLVVKDSINTAGIPTTGGTPALAHYTPMENAPVLQLLLDEGAYVFGKANLAEMSADPIGRNDFFGLVLNPWDTSRITGGTSSGNAVAVSARISPWGIGEDTAGSARIPAAMTGVVGFRPTAGRYPNAGIVPAAPHRDTAGPIARSVEDIALMDSVLTGSPIGLAVAELEGLRIGLPPLYWNVVHPAADQVYQRALATLEEKGVVFVRESIPDLNQIIAANFLSDDFCAMYAALNAYLVEHELGFDFYHVLDNVVTPAVYAVMSRAVPGVIPQETCARSLLETRPKVQALYAQYFAQHAVAAILTPTVVFPAPPIGAATVNIGGEELDALSWAIRNVEPSAFAGLPSLSIPAGLTEPERMPAGLLIDGPAGSDRAVLAIGRAIEEAMPRMPFPAAE